eukprot:CAMPEP_0113887518 /NCGR_PEP_ID=MMETSP0780_2-20120614/12262_1 /TAXON_ID=652834 /ORGANISM="Palpitomonas bilix" /LENGTH=705 /DNA_ID=CAMNT_0000876067 /DNA_START=69 /DNA_END=2186 /DNA_ORIENTATION=+ /assembly_acc=CAM_ASM_000599
MTTDTAALCRPDKVVSVADNEKIEMKEPPLNASASRSTLSFRTMLVFVCLYAFFFQFKASEPFMFEYLMLEKNVSSDEIVGTIFPVSTYGQLAIQPFLAVIPEVVALSRGETPSTSRIPYALAVMIGSLSFLVTILMLIFAPPRSFLLLCLQEVTYSIGFATLPLFTALLFRLVRDRRSFLVTVSVSKAVTLLSIALSGIVGQVLYTYAKWKLEDLYYLTTGSLAVGFVFSLLLFVPVMRYRVGEKEGEDRKEKAHPTAARYVCAHVPLVSDGTEVQGEAVDDLTSSLPDSDGASPPLVRRCEHHPVLSLSPLRLRKGESGRERLAVVLREIGFYFSHTSVVQLSFIFVMLSPAHYLCLTLWQALLGGEGKYNGYVVSGSYLFAAVLNFMLGPFSNLLRRQRLSRVGSRTSSMLVFGQKREEEREESEKRERESDIQSAKEDGLSTRASFSSMEEMKLDREDDALLMSPHSKSQLWLICAVALLAVCLAGMGGTALIGQGGGQRNGTSHQSDGESELDVAATGVSISSGGSTIVEGWTTGVYVCVFLYQCLYEAVLTITTVRLGRLLSMLSCAWQEQSQARDKLAKYQCSEEREGDVEKLGEISAFFHNSCTEPSPSLSSRPPSFDSTRGKYAFMFGLLSFASLVLQTVMQVVLAKRGEDGQLWLAVPFQFLVIAGLAMLAALVPLAIAAVSCGGKAKRGRAGRV